MLVSEVLDRTYSEWLYPAGVDRPSFDILASAMTAGSPAAGETFTVQGKLNVIPPDSILEVGAELIATKDVVTTSVTVAERGWMDSLADAHAIGDLVRVDPKYPRKTLLSHLASIVGMLRPWGLYVRAIDDTDTFSTRAVKTLPAGATRILSILVRASGSTETYTRLKMDGRDWLFYPEFDPPKYQIRRAVGGEGAEMTVVYTTDFTPPAAETDDLDVLGVPSTLQPYLPLGVAGFALQAKEIPRAHIEEIRRMLAASGVNYIRLGETMNLGQMMLNAFRYDYVFAERRRQSESDPVAFGWTRTE